MARPADPEARNRLVAAARAAFAAVGVDGARIEDISRNAGLSKAAFYLHFDSKEQAFIELVEGFFAEIEKASDLRQAGMIALVQEVGLCTAQDWETRSPRFLAYERLDRHATLEALHVMWAWRDVLASVIEHTSGPRRTLVDRFVELARVSVMGRLAEAARLGALPPDLDVELVSEFILGVYMQLARRMCRETTRPDLGHWAQAVDRFVGEGLRPSQPAPPSSGDSS